MPKNSFAFMVVMAMKLPERETNVYNHVLQSLLLKVRSEAGVTAEEVPLNVPVLYYGHWDETEPMGSNMTAVVVQDLKPLGFHMADKQVGLTLEEAKLALETMAHYHALSLALVEKFRNPDGSFTLSDDIKFLSEGPSFHQQMAEMMKTFLPQMIEMMKRMGHQEVWSLIRC